MAKWLPLFPPIAAALIAAGLFWHELGSSFEPEMSPRPLTIIVLAALYVLAGRRGTAR